MSVLKQKLHQKKIPPNHFFGELEGYLVGSIHLMKSNAYPLDPVFNKAFTRSNLTVASTGNK